MLQKGVNFSMFVPAELDVFLEGKVTRAAGLSSEMKSGNCFELDTVELFTRLLCWHGRRNHTTTEMWRNGTLVLRKRRQEAAKVGKSMTTLFRDARGFSGTRRRLHSLDAWLDRLLHAHTRETPLYNGKYCMSSVLTHTARRL